MITTRYEDTYDSVQQARKFTADLDKVVEVLSKASEPMTCHDIGFSIWGVGYLDNRRRASHMGQILKHLREGGFITVEKRTNGEPIEIEYEKWVNLDKDGNPPTIKVHDDEGNEYLINNPKYSGYGGGRIMKVKKTVTPTIKVYSLVR